MNETRLKRQRLNNGTSSPQQGVKKSQSKGNEFLQDEHSIATTDSESQFKRQSTSNDARSDPHISAKPGPENPSETLWTAATVKDRIIWKGWCEIESEPAFFNVMLKEFGVKGVKIREVFSLENEILSFLPKPVYGLIFLFKWREDDPTKQVLSCPLDVWFANQTVDNACASVAMLNILNNIPDIDLGEHLQSFKDFTREFNPALRGYAISNFEFIRHIHNSFARRMDMLNGDLHMENQIQNSKRRRTKFNDDDESSAGFHFVAYVPINGNVWKLDGLERQPQDLGALEGEEWLNQVKPDIEARMAEYEDGQIEFAMLSLVKDPLISLADELAGNVKEVQAIIRRLKEVSPDWRNVPTSVIAANGDLVNPRTLLGPDLSYLLEQKAIDASCMTADEQWKLMESSGSDLLKRYRYLESAQERLKVSIKDEQRSDQQDEETAAGRRHDCGPAIHTWYKALLELDHPAKRVIKVFAGVGQSRAQRVNR